MRLTKIIAAVVIAGTLSSCNTLIGIGRDIKQGTGAIGSGVSSGGENVGEGLENTGYGKTWRGQ